LYFINRGKRKGRVKIEREREGEIVSEEEGEMEGKV